MRVHEILNNQLDEGAWDYVKGMGQHLGGKFVDKMSQTGRQIAQPFVDAHRAGQQSSRQRDIEVLTRKKQQLLQQLLGFTEQTSPQVVINIINKTFAQKQINLCNKIKKDFAVAAQARSAPTNEGVFDYLKGASRSVGGQARQAGQGINRAAGQAGRSISGAARQVGDAVSGAASQVGRSIGQAGQSIAGAASNVHQQGRQASLIADMQKTVQQLGQVYLKLAKL